MYKFLFRLFVTLSIAFALLVWVLSDGSSSSAEQSIKNHVIDAAENTGDLIRDYLEKRKEKEDDAEKKGISLMVDFDF